jgi:hypothetical protein
LNIFLEYLKLNQIQDVSSQQVKVIFHHCKK